MERQNAGERGKPPVEGGEVTGGKGREGDASPGREPTSPLAVAATKARVSAVRVSVMADNSEEAGAAGRVPGEKDTEGAGNPRAERRRRRA
jgi:hypothetical protein